ncbi:MAG: hypothetical protein HFJ25_06675 [Clostridia bacterium]|nr:hypothetical protein [Clostridia bacterium]
MGYYKCKWCSQSTKSCLRERCDSCSWYGGDVTACDTHKPMYSGTYIRACTEETRQSCSACGGVGTIKVTPKCSSCGGSGTKTCTNCSGSGTKSCSTCNGQGTTTNTNYCSHSSWASHYTCSNHGKNVSQYH